MRNSRCLGSGVLGVLSSALVLAACADKTVSLGGEEQRNGVDGGISSGGARGSDGGVTPGSGGQPGAPDTAPDPTPTVSKSPKVDLLLMVDNSISMADKQTVLKRTIPDLVNRLTAPGSGITDLHVGIISSSLGDHGNDKACAGRDDGSLREEEQNDHGRLITTRPRAAAGAPGVPTVITWNSSESAATLTTQIQEVVSVVGESGCGLEAQFESTYHFLVDPHPWANVTLESCAGGKCAVQVGVDQAVLDQRAAFLRPDSSVAIVLLTDENDCSIRDDQQYFYAADENIVLPKGSSACEADPNDRCCYSCATHAPDGCPADPACAQPTSNASQDSINLRCFDEKRRFGIDFLYPVERYLTAFTRAHLCTSRADLVPSTTDCPDADGDGSPDIVQNPLFYGQDGTVRDPRMVYVLGMTGVPWQDLAKGGPSAAVLEYKSARDLSRDGTWNVILGDPDASPSRLPTDGLMVESRAPRSGADVNGVPIPGPAGPSNGINGHDWANVANDDMMYSCIYALPEPRDCTLVQSADPAPGCDCGSNFNSADNNPLCQSPVDGTYGHTQYFAKAYPGVRELSLLKSLGNQGVTASVCPKNLEDTGAADYGYRPAVSALLSALGSTAGK